MCTTHMRLAYYLSVQTFYAYPNVVGITLVKKTDTSIHTAGGSTSKIKEKHLKPSSFV